MVWLSKAAIQDCKSNSIIVRYAEIALKGKNRGMFEKRLVRNIRECLKSTGAQFSDVHRIRGRIVIMTPDSCQALKRVFGISSYSHAICTEPDKIRSSVDMLLKNVKFETFRVSAKRIDKTHPANSMEVNKEIGQYIVDNYSKKVSLNSYDLELGVEFMGSMAYVFTDEVQGPKGMPYGSNGQVFAIINSKNSLVAAWLMMKRGLRIRPVGKPGVLEKYSYGYSMKQEKSHNPKAPVVVDDTLDKISDPNSVLVLRPLVGMTSAGIAKKLKYINDEAKEQNHAGTHRIC